MDVEGSTRPPAAVRFPAVAAAMVRARESVRQDALFRDPLAQPFADAATAGMDPAGLRALRDRVELFFSRSVIRTRFIDDELRTATDGPCRQVVLLGAGLDARAFRLRWPRDARLFEVDAATLFALKERVLGAVPRFATRTCPRIVVESDPGGDWAGRLVESRFDATAPTAWVAEGALPYLSDPETAELFLALTTLSAPGSRLVFELSGTGIGTDLLSRLGWSVHSHDRAAVGATYGRRDSRLQGGRLVTATRD